MTFKKLDVIVSDSNGENEKRRRLTFERPDIAHVRGEICRRFEVDLRGETSIQARVNGSQREYAISSNEDLVDLWEEIEELYVVVPVARTTGLVVVFNDYEDARRIKFESQDYDEIVEQVCDQFQAEKCSLAGIIEGDETKFSITSNEDIKELWSHLEKLLVTGKKKRPTAGLVVVFNDDETKRITFESQEFHEIIKLICAQFHAETFTLECTVEGDDTKYSITTNEDINELWSDIDKLYVTGIKKRLKVDTKVLMKDDPYTYHIDREPGRNSKVYQDCLSNHNLSASSIKETDAGIKRMGDVTNIMYYAAVGTGDVRLQTGTKELGLKVIEICHAADNTLGSYVLTCSEVNEKFRMAVQYMFEDDYKRALRVIGSLAGSANLCKENTDTVIRLIDNTLEADLLSETGLDMVVKGKEAANDLYEKSKKDLAAKQKELSLLQKYPSSHSQETDDDSGSSTVAYVGATTLGATAVIASAATLAAPVFLLGAGALALGRYLVKKATEKSARKAEEKRRKEEAERKRQLENLKIMLEQLPKDIENAKSNTKCFKALTGELVIMRISLFKIKAFFNHLLGFCVTIQTGEGMGITECVATSDSNLDGKLDCKKLLESQAIKEAMVFYHANWTALKHVCQDCQRTLINTNKELHKRIEENPTRQEAKAVLGDMVKNAKRRYQF